MKKICHYLLIGLILAWLPVQSIGAGDRVIAVSTKSHLNHGLDLDAVGQIFKDSADLYDFELRLNHHKSYVNNLDLNSDGQVDYIRVIEEATSNGRFIILQAVTGKDTYTDVAYIDVTKKGNRILMQIRGEAQLYGANHYIVPRYSSVNRWPVLMVIFDPVYELYYSPYSWDLYPKGWSSQVCVRMGLYRSRLSYKYHSNWFRHSYIPYVVDYVRVYHDSHCHLRDYSSYRGRSSWNRYHSDFRDYGSLKDRYYNRYNRSYYDRYKRYEGDNEHYRKHGSSRKSFDKRPGYNYEDGRKEKLTPPTKFKPPSGIPNKMTPLPKPNLPIAKPNIQDFQKKSRVTPVKPRDD